MYTYAVSWVYRVDNNTNVWTKRWEEVVNIDFYLNFDSFGQVCKPGFIVGGRLK